MRKSTHFCKGLSELVEGMRKRKYSEEVMAENFLEVVNSINPQV